MSAPSYPTVEAGVYRHYKDHHYLVLGVASDSNADALWHEDEGGERWRSSSLGTRNMLPFRERLVVVYIGLELPGSGGGPRMHVRDYDDFFAWTHPDGTACGPRDVVMARMDDDNNRVCTSHALPIEERFKFVGAAVPVVASATDADNRD